MNLCHHTRLSENFPNFKKGLENFIFEITLTLSFYTAVNSFVLGSFILFLFDA